MIKQLFVTLLVLQLFSCNTSEKKSNKEQVDELRAPLLENELLLKEDTSKKYYISAASGLNYRDTPKGIILGKFPVNTEVEIVKHSGVFQDIKDEGEEIHGEWVGVKKNTDTVYIFNAFLSTSKVTENNESIWTSFPIRKTPMIDSTNFDNIKEGRKINLKEIKTLQLETIYPDFKKEGHSYKFTAGYQLEISKQFKTFVVCVYKGDHELESVLINYDLKGKLLDSERISYDEIAEGWSRETATIKNDCILTINALYTDAPQIDTTLFHINRFGGINSVKTKFKNNLKPNKIVRLNKIYTDTIQFLKYNDDYDYFYIEAKKKGKNVSLIYNWNTTGKYAFKKGDIIKVKWKMDSIMIAGDGNTLAFSEWAIDAEKIKE